MKVENRAEKQHMTAASDVILVKSCKEGTETNMRLAEPESFREESSRITREILREHRLELVVNERLFARLVCTPDDWENLVVGRLITERIISDVEEIEQLYLCESGNRARVFLKKDVKFKAAEAEEPTCCTDNRVFLQAVRMASRDGDQEQIGQGQVGQEQVTQVQDAGGQSPRQQLPHAVWKKEWIFSIVKAFAEDSRLHRSTGGTHSCMLAMEGRVLYCVEDLGRHNAMDKAIGYAAMQGLDREKCILFTTGRVPTDMVRKAVAARIPVLISKAVPTAEAVEMARESGLTLICRAWPDSFEVYAGEA